jgi:hypothetical protein
MPLCDESILTAPQGDPQWLAVQIIKAGIDPQSRPEGVGLEQYVALSNLLKPV